MKEKLKFLVAKHFVAGGSAKYMFDMQTDEAIQYLRIAMITVLRNKSNPRVRSKLHVRYNMFDFGSDGYGDPRVVSLFSGREMARGLGPDTLRFNSEFRADPFDGHDHSLQCWFFAELAHNGATYRVYDDGDGEQQT